MSSSSQNMDFWDLPALGLEKNRKISWFWVNNGKKHQCTNKLWNGKKTKNNTTNNPYIGI